MSSTLEQPAVRAYLEQLKRLLGTSPDRDAVLDDITLHIQTAAAEDPTNEVVVRQILAELGDPASIAAGASTSPRTTPPRTALHRTGAVAVVLLLAFGGLAAPALGWGIADFTIPALIWLVGFVLLWATAGWTVRDKIVGTFTIPVVFAVVILIEKLGLQDDPTAAVGFAAFVGYVLLAVATSIYLLVRFRPRTL